MTTPTPCGARRSCRNSAICWVSRSWTCSRRAYISTIARDLGQADDPAARDVGDRGRPEERQQVVLAQRVERDVLDDDHLAVVDVEDRAVDEPLRVDVVAGRQLGVHPVDALGRAAAGPGGRGPRRSRRRISVDGRLDPAVAVDAARRPRSGARRSPGDRLADLGLDLVDDGADVGGQVGRRAHDAVDGTSGVFNSMPTTTMGSGPTFSSVCRPTGGASMTPDVGAAEDHQQVDRRRPAPDARDRLEDRWRALVVERMRDRPGRACRRRARSPAHGRSAPSGG